MLLWCLVLACKQSTAPAKPSLFDTSLHKYIAALDTIPAYGHDINFLTLKALSQKDTAYFIKLNERMNLWSKTSPGYFDKCPPVPSLDTALYDEAYRLQITYSFYRNNIYATAYKKDGRFFIHLLEMGFATIYPNKRMVVNYDTCKIFKTETKEIDKPRWDSLLSKIEYAGYWGMSPFIDQHGWTDGTFWRLEAVIGRSYKYLSATERHLVARRSPEETAFGQIGLYMLSLLGEKNYNFYKSFL